MWQWFDRREHFGHPYETDIVLLNNIFLLFYILHMITHMITYDHFTYDHCIILHFTSDYTLYNLLCDK